MWPRATRALSLAALALDAAEPRGGCPRHSSCASPELCPDELAARFSYHWDVERIVEERAVCTCDTGFAAASGCRDESRCGTHLGGVHAEVSRSGRCDAMVHLSVRELPAPHLPARGCQAEVLRRCHEDGSLEDGASEQRLAALRSRWAEWWAERAGNSTAPPVQGAVTVAQRLCFDARKVMDRQVVCACDSCSVAPEITVDIDLLGDGSCVYQARDCVVTDRAQRFVLGTAFLIFAGLGCCGFYCLNRTQEEKKQEKRQVNRSRWQGAGKAAGKGALLAKATGKSGGGLGAMRLAGITQMAMQKDAVRSRSGRSLPPAAAASPHRLTTPAPLALPIPGCSLSWINWCTSLLLIAPGLFAPLESDFGRASAGDWGPLDSDETQSDRAAHRRLAQRAAGGTRRLRAR